MQTGQVPYPPTVNDPAETAFAARVLDALVGPERVDRERPPVMGGEDFSFMAQERPGCFVLIGNGETAPLHTTRYDFNDEVAPLGVAYWAKLVETALPAR
jgi:hippurate hydrolase